MILGSRTAYKLLRCIRTAVHRKPGILSILPESSMLAVAIWAMLGFRARPGGSLPGFFV